MSAFAQKQRTLPIDTNIRRVLGRLLLGKPFATLADDEKIRSKADFLPRRGAYYDVPQATSTWRPRSAPRILIVHDARCAMTALCRAIPAGSRNNPQTLRRRRL